MNGTKNRQLLVVDDNRAIHDDFRKLLEVSSPRTKVLADIETSLFDDVPGVPMRRDARPYCCVLMPPARSVSPNQP